MKKIHNSLKETIFALKKGKIIAYPTESVFALGCDPENKKAIKKLLSIKKRSWKKGFILLASHYKQIIPYIDEKKIDKTQKKKILQNKLITWVIPKKKYISKLLSGKHNSIAIRMINLKLIKKLCYLYGKPIISTSANLNGFSPCKKKKEIINQFNNKIFILNGSLGNKKKTSKIQDIITNHQYRK